jgi:hypothetical protein
MWGRSDLGFLAELRSRYKNHIMSPASSCHLSTLKGARMRRKTHSAKMVYHSRCISLFHCSWVSKALITEILPLRYITELSANPIGLLVGKQEREKQ